MTNRFQEGLVYLVLFFEDDAFQMVSFVQEYMCMYYGYGMVQLTAVGKNLKCCPEEIWVSVCNAANNESVCIDNKNKCITNSKWYA